MTDRYADLVRRLRQAVLLGPGVTGASLRQAVEARAAALGGRLGEPAAVPTDLAGFVDKVARHAYRVTADDVAALRRAGHPEDAVFEITAAAALGAALGRLERGMAALRGEV